MIPAMPKIDLFR